MTGSHRRTQGHRGLVLGGVFLGVLLVAGVTVAVKDNSNTHRTAVHNVAAVGSTSPTSASTAPAPATTSAALVPTVPAVATTNPVVTVVRVALLTYVVKPGDNLTIIAAWFHQHGYGALYERNKAVLGANPDLIHPGQRITISAAGVSMH